jgi:hypothetical protein
VTDEDLAKEVAFTCAELYDACEKNRATDAVLGLILSVRAEEREACSIAYSKLIGHIQYIDHVFSCYLETGNDRIDIAKIYPPIKHALKEFEIARGSEK